jgi:hypothetical protein
VPVGWRAHLMGMETRVPWYGLVSAAVVAADRPADASHLFRAALVKRPADGGAVGRPQARIGARPAGRRPRGSRGGVSAWTRWGFLAGQCPDARTVLGVLGVLSAGTPIGVRVVSVAVVERFHDRTLAGLRRWNASTTRDSWRSWVVTP